MSYSKVNFIWLKSEHIQLPPQLAALKYKIWEPDLFLDLVLLHIIFIDLKLWKYLVSQILDFLIQNIKFLIEEKLLCWDIEVLKSAINKDSWDTNHNFYQVLDRELPGQLFE